MCALNARFGKKEDDAWLACCVPIELKVLAACKVVVVVVVAGKSLGPNCFAANTQEQQVCVCAWCERHKA